MGIRRDGQQENDMRTIDRGVLTQTIGAHMLERKARVNQRTLKSWRLKGVVQPTVAGRPGRGLEARYSLRQALGICLLAVRAKMGTTGIEYATRIIRMFSEMSDEAVLAFVQEQLGNPTD